MNEELQEEYRTQFQRTTGKQPPTFAYCGGGWYAMHFAGDNGYCQRVQWGKLLRMTNVLKTRPDYNS